MASQGPREDEIGPGWTIGTMFCLAALAVAWAPFWGMEHIPFDALWGGADDSAADILWKMRIPRVLLSFLAGSALAAAGMVFQALFRNPLATPFTLGVASGASLGAAVCYHCGWSFALLGVSAVSISALLGAVLSIVLVYVLTSTGRQGSSTATMLLAGVAVSFTFSSLILFMQYISDPSKSFQMLRWVMGGMRNVVGFSDVLNVFAFVVSGCLIVWYLLLDLNLLSTGEDFAFTRGVNVNQAKAMLFFAVSLMVGAVVAVCGPIGFVGLMAPHICRLLIGPDHRLLYPAALLFGGVLLVVCDTISRIILAPTELPVGILTALLGGPFFLWLLLARRRDLGVF
ncbi:MAG: iron ABC transporter permease [Pirellulales bacterium]|nr:iron ABC transporter permease [Pirellulales bacterium]